MLELRRRLRYKSIILTILVIFSIFTYFLFNFYSRKKLITFEKSLLDSGKKAALDLESELGYLKLKNSGKSPSNAVEAGNLSYDQLKSGLFKKFDLDSSDVIVFLHVQKTGGTTFERYMVRQLQQKCHCTLGKKKCQCRRTNGRGIWLFSRYSTGWSCGLHADWTELVESGCVDRVLARKEHKDDMKNGVDSKPVNRRFFLATLFRQPVARFLSEFRHMMRGATWSASPHLCDGRYPSAEELPHCFDPQLGWTGVTFEEFVACPHNLASNRQTRMLADLTTVGCYNRSYIQPESERNRLLLESAKGNLLKMTFFGLQEDMRRSQYIFERTFDLQFNKILLNWNESTDLENFEPWQLEKVRNLNSLDLDLYEFAKKLFEKRFEELKKSDPLFDFNMAPS